MSYLGESIPKLGFGLMRLPRTESGEIDIPHVCDMVDAFLDAGCTYFDTARMYDGSEAAIRKALVERYPRESFQLASKNAAWAKAKDAAQARADFDVSLELTGTDYLDFYLIHNTGGARTAAFDRFDMWNFVIQLKEQGKVRHIGFSHHDNAELLDELLTAHPEMEFVQLQVNYADWEDTSVQSRKCVEVVQKHGKSLVIMEPVHGGTLATPPEPVAQLLRETNPDASYVSWALRFAMGMPNLITVLSGMSNMQQMQENLETWKNYQPLSAEENAVLEQARVKLAELTDNPCTACHYCMKGCPMNINISAAMDSLNRAALYDPEKAKGHYNFESRGWGRAGECIQCGQCEDACPQHIPIIEKLERAAALFEYDREGGSKRLL